MTGYPGPPCAPPVAPPDPGAAVAVALRLAPAPGAPDGAPELSFFSTLTTFGTAVDVSVSELAVEAFFPADETTAAALRA